MLKRSLNEHLRKANREYGRNNTFSPRSSIVVSYKSFVYCRVTLKQENCEKLQSVGYKNIAISEKHVNSWGDVLLFVRYVVTIPYT